MTPQSIEKLARQEAAGKNRKRFLDFIARMEGTLDGAWKDTIDPYRVGFGGRPIQDLSWHPNVSSGFTQTDGKKRTTDAAGKYQILGSTWERAAKKLGITDFTPESQDKVAIELLLGRKALKHVDEGNFVEALRLAGPEWASLPTAPDKYKQKRRSAEETMRLAKLSGVDLPGMPKDYASTIKAANDSGIDLSASLAGQTTEPQQEDYQLAIARVQEQEQQAENERIAKAQERMQRELEKTETSATMQKTRDDISNMLSDATLGTIQKSIGSVLPTEFDRELRSLIKAV